MSLRAPELQTLQVPRGPLLLPGRQRFNFIGGLRTLAALQVVLLHCMAAFLPAAALVPGTTRFGWEHALAGSPLAFLFDGYLALDVFFIVSGFVLAQSFLAPGRTFGPAAVKRILRLVLPVAASVLVAVPLLHLFPAEHHQAALLSGSTWLDGFSTNFGILSGLGNIVGLMAVGGLGVSVFSRIAPLARHLAPLPVSASINPPMWSMHWELWGSIVLLALATLRRRTPDWLFRLVFVVALVVFGTSELGLLLLGFVAYLGRRRLLGLRLELGPPTGLVPRLVAGPWSGPVLIAGGVAVSVMALRVGPAWAGTLAHLPGLRAVTAFDLLNEAGATLLFIGILVSARARRFLAWRPLARLGEVTISVYFIHFPVLLTLGCLAFRVLEPHGYLLAASVATLACLSTSLLIGLAFMRAADRPAARLASRVAGFLEGLRGPSAGALSHPPNG